MRRSRDHVYPSFTARLIPDSSGSRKLAAFIKDHTGQELPFPDQGVLLHTPQGIRRAVVRPSTPLSLQVTILSTEVTCITTMIARWLPTRQYGAALLGDLEERYRRIEHREGRKAASKWLWKQIILSTRALLDNWLRRY